MKYLLITKRGNGYHCGCCREEYEDHRIEEFDTEKDMKKYCKIHNDNWQKNDEKILFAYKLENEIPVYQCNDFTIDIKT